MATDVPTRLLYRCTLDGATSNFLRTVGDSFGRIRTSQPRSLLSLKQTDVQVSPLILASAVSGGGVATYDSTYSHTRLTCPGAIGTAILQSAHRPSYESAKSQEIVITGTLGASNLPGATFRMGQFDASDGIFMEAQGVAGAFPNYFLTLRSSTIPDESVAQADWNIDTLGANPARNPSGKTYQVPAGTILHISYEWLGVGGVLVSMVLDNEIVPLHFFPHAGIYSTVYMKTPNLPLRWELVSTNAAISPGMNAICGAVISEGGAEERGFLRSDYQTAAVASGSGEVRELLSMRLRCGGTTDGLEAITSASVFPEDVGCVNTSNDAGMLIMGYNPTFTGAGTWADPIGTNGSLSHVQISKTNRLVTSPGHVFFAQPFSSVSREAKGAFDKTISLGCRPKITSGYGVADVISLMHVNLSGSTTDTVPAMTWREVQ